MVDSTDGLHLGSVGEHLTTIDIADGIDPLNRCLKVLVNGDTLAFVVFETSIRKVGLHTGFPSRCHQDDIGLNAFRLTFLSLEEHLTISNLLDTTLHIERDALLFHQLAQTFGDIAVEGREALLQELDDCHL